MVIILGMNYYKKRLKEKLKKRSKPSVNKPRVMNTSGRRRRMKKPQVSHIDDERDIVILSTGAHIRNSDCDFVAVIDEVLDRLYSKWLPSNDFLFVWKTQNPAGCTNKIHHPDNPVLAGMDFSPSSVTHEYHKQFWNRDEYVLTQIDERNKQLAKKLLLSKSSSSAHAHHHHEAIMNKVHTLDMRMLYSRTDAHPGSPTLNNNQNVSEKPPDCLHYFAHGPLDVIGPLFQQLLEDIK